MSYNSNCRPPNKISLETQQHKMQTFIENMIFNQVIKFLKISKLLPSNKVH